VWVVEGRILTLADLSRRTWVQRVAGWVVPLLVVLPGIWEWTAGSAVRVRHGFAPSADVRAVETLYSPDPDSLWNRIFLLFFRRSAP
jgi:hypothetical protein